MSDPMDCGCSLTSEIQCQIYKGYGQAANVLGLPYSHYRVSLMNNPVSPGNLIGTIKAQFALQKASFNFTKSPSENQIVFDTLIDGTACAVGDVLINQADATDFYYIAQMRSLMPVISVKCDSLVNIFRPTTVLPPGGGANGATLIDTYSGDTAASEGLLYSGVPAAIQYKDRDTRPTTPLPADTTRPGGWNIYLPLYAGLPPIGIMENDIIADDLGKRYQVEAADQSAIGFKLHCRFLKA